MQRLFHGAYQTLGEKDSPREDSVFANIRQLANVLRRWPHKKIPLPERVRKRRRSPDCIADLSNPAMAALLLFEIPALWVSFGFGQPYYSILSKKVKGIPIKFFCEFFCHFLRFV